MTRPQWPFMSSDQRFAPQPTQQPEPDLCECDLEHLTGEAVQTNRCANCGKAVVA